MDIVVNSARYAREDQSAINCTVVIGGEELPYTAVGGDASTSSVWSALLAGEAGDIAGYIPPEIPDLSPEQIIEMFRASIQAHVDQTAISKRYDSGNSMASYVSSTVPQWSAEAQAFVAWRDAVWAYAYAEMDKVIAEDREQPTVDDLLEELPKVEWPE